VSDYTALRTASTAIAGVLRAAFMADPALSVLFGASHVVTLDTPREMRTGQHRQIGLSVWLYRVERNEFLTNRRPERPDPHHTRRTPLPLDLHYLLTAVSDDTATEQAIMGKVFQVLYDSPVLPADPSRPDLQENLRICLENMDLEAITRVWHALEESYLLCASYLVQAVDIASGLQPALGSPVLARLGDVDQVVGVT
jgi:hypothetical protein